MARARSGRLRVLVVDDSATQRAALIALLEMDPDLEVAGTASNGVDALRAASRLAPDVVTMDLRMPVMDGLEASRRIMQETPCPIVMVTASGVREDTQLAFEAMQAGVLAVVAKPAAVFRDAEHPGGLAPAAAELLRTVKNMAGVKVIRRWAPGRVTAAGAAGAARAAGAAAAISAPAPLPAVLPSLARAPEIVAIGASTGGPQALSAILSQLPADFPLTIVIVQHIALGFTEGLVDWLRTQCALPVSVAATGTSASARGVHVAPNGRHLTVQRRQLVLTDDPPVGPHRPSATTLFQSVARDYRAGAIGVLLSGMGDDGAAGLRDMKRAGAITVAQDEASSVVFGMPAVAIRMGVVDHVLPAARIGPLLTTLVPSPHRSGV